MAKSFVTLNVNGEIQKLTLERSSVEEKGQVIKSAPPPPPIETVSADSGAINSRNILSKVNIAPNFVNQSGTKVQNGFKITPKSGVDLSTVGLRSGDVLSRIGPVVLNGDQSSLADLHDLISKGGAQDVEILRNGSPVTIRIGQ